MNITLCPISTIEKRIHLHVVFPIAVKLSTRRSSPISATNNHVPEHGWTKTSTASIAVHISWNRPQKVIVDISIDCQHGEASSRLVERLHHYSRGSHSSIANRLVKLECNHFGNGAN